MTDCPNGDVRDLLPDYLHDRLAPASRQVVERHLEGCAACRDELALLRDLRGIMGGAPHVDVAAIAAAIPPYGAKVRRGLSGGWRAAAAIAAIAVGGTSVALLARTSHAPPPVSSRVAVLSQPRTPEAPSVRGPAGDSVQQPPSRSPREVARATTPARESSNSAEPELAMAGGAITDLSDRELSTLLENIESLDAVPSADVEVAEPLSPAIVRDRR